VKIGQLDTRRIVVTDFESFFDSADGYSLRKLRNEEYIMDRRWKVHGLAVAYHTGKTDWIEGPDVPKWLKSYKTHTFIGHKMTFDGLVWWLRYRHVAPFMLDTLYMANAVFGPAETSGGNDLDSVAQRLGHQPKGKIDMFDGVRDLSVEEHKAMRVYGTNDADLEFKIFRDMLPMMTRPEFELWLIDHSLRVYITRPLPVNVNKCKSTIKLVQDKIKEKLAALPRIVFNCQETRGSGKKKRVETIKRTVDESVLASNKQFGQALLQTLKTRGVQVPKKMGKNGIIPALAKADEGFMALKNHKDKAVAGLVQARLVKRSGDTQIARLRSLLLTAATGGFRPMLNYHGASTGRWTGGGGLNCHNFPNPTKSPDEFEREVAAKIHECVEPPTGCKFTANDAANIEARVLAQWAGQQDLVDAFGNGEDVYSSFAQEAFGEEVRKPKKEDPPKVFTRLKRLRNAGKGAVLGLGYCLAKGTPVLTKRGFVAIENVMLADKVWDGEEWVEHDGVVATGRKAVVLWNGIALTPQHLLLCKSGWHSVAEIASSGGTLCPLLAQSTDDGQWLAVKLTSEQSEEFQSDATVATKRAFARISWSEAGVLSVDNVPIAGPDKEADNHASTGCLTPNHDDGSRCGTTSTNDVTTPPTTNTRITGAEESSFDFQKQTSSRMSDPCRTPTTLLSTSTDKTTTGTTNGEICDSSLRLRICVTETFDVTNAGPNHRYQAGPAIVHNSMSNRVQPGKQYGKFESSLRSNPDTKELFDTGDLDKRKCDELVELYRKKYPKIIALWGRAEAAFFKARDGASRMVNGVLFSPGNGRGVDVTLPCGRVIHYPNVRTEKHIYGGKEKTEWVYGHGKGKKVYGGLLVENIVQAMSRDILAEAVYTMETSGYPVAFHIHDSIACTPRVKDAEECLKLANETLSASPDWAPGMKLGSEGEISEVMP
jgi:hypothetical protein